MKARNAHAMILMAILGAGLSAQAKSMDDQIEASARNSYNFKHYLKNDRIKVRSQNGAVTLTGTVSESSHDAIAFQTVSSLPDVRTVWDSLKVTGKQPAENSDAWILAKIKSALLFHSSVSALTNVTVKDGNVMLRGEADSDAEKELTTEYVRDVEGVKDVDNKMTVTHPSKKKKRTVGEQMDDASITAQIKVTLLTHRSTSVLNTHVETTKGIVHLTGKAKNMAEKDLVSKLVEDVNGVKSVRNEMTY